jgi:hypothetical protein
MFKGFSNPISEKELSCEKADKEYLDGLKTMTRPSEKTYLPAVSPWFFTHYGADSYNKNVQSILSS